MELTEITKEMYETTKRIDKASKEVFKLAKNRAETERIYREALAKEMMKLRNEGIPATQINDLARGNVAYLKFERDLALELHRSALSSLGAIETQASVLQTISRYQETI
ncbi:hypothetical protein SAMN05192534_12350 [Alteribacillus persepolensis]|uniref:Uncharacterized protein n=1 Tax=Alteribacillus persepolensis TaxID=568899 RepID=A0A1G8I941_9BACI|nr:hypothetical protein [Alteribacillus persepolensis]SDI15478.1 hypothetical protein SAMN05192534_12350 [Alteribacillus persepolensis]